MHACLQMNRPGVLEALTLLPEDPHIVSRYRSLAQSTAGSPDVPRMRLPKSLPSPGN